MESDKRQQQYPFDKFASIKRYIGFDFLKKDPSWIIYIADTNGQFNLWRQHIGESYASQLTNFIDNAVRNAFSSPLDDSIIFFADHQGTENFQIYKINNVFYSLSEPITQNPNARYECGMECFSHDGTFITYSSNETNPLNMLVYVRNLTRNEMFCITDKPGWYIPGYWSPDSKKINCFQPVTLTDFNIWLLDIVSKEMVHVMPYTDKSRKIVGPWSPDGQGFYIITDLNREYTGLAFFDINKLKLEWILTPQYAIESVNLSKDGNTLVWTENVDGFSNAYIKDLKNGEIQEISEHIVKKGVIGNLKISSDGKTIGISMATPTSPCNIYTIDIESKKVTKLTEALLGIPKRKMIQPQLVKYKSFDELEIQAFLYKPLNGNYNNNKFGAVISIHGGPTYQEKPSYAYAGLYQYLVNNGIAVLAPNFRGSTGYGKSFEKKIYHDWGGNELKDLEYAVKWLISQEWVDATRIGVFGVSFGGFATLNCITRLPQYDWKAAIDIVGPSNLVTFAKTVPEHWKRFMAELVGDPEKEQDFLKERSPITYADEMKLSTNLLIIQGRNDPRVVKSESDQMVERLRKRGIVLEYMVFDDEGHGFTKYSNLIKALSKSAEFLACKLQS